MLSIFYLINVFTFIKFKTTKQPLFHHKFVQYAPKHTIIWHNLNRFHFSCRLKMFPVSGFWIEYVSYVSNVQNKKLMQWSMKLLLKVPIYKHALFLLSLWWEKQPFCTFSMQCWVFSSLQQKAWKSYQRWLARFHIKICNFVSMQCPWNHE